MQAFNAPGTPLNKLDKNILGQSEDTFRLDFNTVMLL